MAILNTYQIASKQDLRKEAIEAFKYHSMLMCLELDVANITVLINPPIPHSFSYLQFVLWKAKNFP